MISYLHVILKRLIKRSLKYYKDFFRNVFITFMTYPNNCYSFSFCNRYRRQPQFQYPVPTHTLTDRSIWSWTISCNHSIFTNRIFSIFSALYRLGRVLRTLNGLPRINIGWMRDIQVQLMCLCRHCVTKSWDHKSEPFIKYGNSKYWFTVY